MTKEQWLKNRGQGKGVAASELAAYAENPSRFAKAKGGAYNAAAARYGDRYHHQMGRLSFRQKLIWLTVFIALSTGIYFSFL